jgi:SLT domain-containing protein
MFGRPDLLPALLMQMNTESGGNANAQNNWDSNAKAGTPSKGLMQVIDPTFLANAGPFAGLGIFNPLANIYAAVAYALKRYGSNLAAIWGHGHGYALGGVVNEPVMGVGLHSGSPYSFGERGPEVVSPLSGPGASLSGGARTVINVYPSAGMNERELAAMVSRELAWAHAGGIA